MTHTKSLGLASSLTAIVLGTALVAGCTIKTSDGTEPATVTPVPGTPVADGGTDAATASGCDFGEPNDTRETSKVIDLNHAYAGLCVSNPDHADELDFFEFTAPASDLAGGVVEVQISNVQNDGNAEFIVTSGADNGVIIDAYSNEANASVSGWLSVTPGATYRIQVNRFGGAGTRFAYDLFAKYTAIIDTFEPNNRKEDAKPIALNATIEATAAAHSAKAVLAAGDDEDWFKVSLAMGSATFKMTNVASDYLCDVELLNDAGEKVDEKYETTPGADCVLESQNLPAGSYFLKIHSFGGLPVRGEPKPVPAAFMLQPYKFVVQQ